MPIFDRARAAVAAFRQGPSKQPPREMQGEVAYADPLRLFPSSTFRVWNPNEIAGRKGLRVLDQMHRDDQVKAALTFKKQAVTASGWSIEPPGEDGKPSTKSDAATDFVAADFTNLRTPTDIAINGVLSALGYGFSVTEMVFEPGPDSLIHLVDLKTKSPHGIGFKIDPFGNLTPDGLIQDQPANMASASRGGQVPLPVAKFLLFRYQEEFGNPYGCSDLEAAWRPWWLKDNAYKWLGMLLERFGIPPMALFYSPENLQPVQIDQLKSVLKGLQAGTSFMLPRVNKDAFELWTPELAGQVAEVFIPALDMCNKDISRALLMPGLLGMTPEALGSYARAKVVFDVFMLVVDSTRRQVERAVNAQVVRPLVDLNFGVKRYPEFKFKPLTDDQEGELLRTWLSLVRGGLVRKGPEDEAHLRRRMGFPERNEEEFAEPSGRDIFSYHLNAGDEEGGVLEINELRQALGFEPKPWGNERIKPAANRTAPVGGDGEQDGGEGERGEAGEEEDPEAEERRRQRQQNNPDADPEDEEIEDEDEAGGKKRPPRRNAAHDHRRDHEGDDTRQPWPEEERVDFAAIARDMDEIEDAALDDIASAAWRSANAFFRELQLAPAIDADLATRAKLELGDGGLRAFRRFLVGALNAGRASLARDVKPVISERRHTEANYAPQAAMDFLKLKADFFVSGLDEVLTQIVRAELLFGLQQGLKSQEVTQRIRDALAPVIGPEDAAAEVLRGSRIGTIVVTNQTAAFNQGRLVEARRSGVQQFVKGMMYSAIMDAKTTAVCRSLDGLRFRLDDPDLDRLTPPNHYRCRSVLTPITILDESEDWATNEEKGKAYDLADPKFGGDTKPAPAFAREAERTVPADDAS